MPPAPPSGRQIVNYAVSHGTCRSSSSDGGDLWRLAEDS